MSWVNPSDFRAGAEWIKSTQHPKEARAGDPLHAWWVDSAYKLPPIDVRHGITASRRFVAWCGVRLRLIMPEPFDPHGERACLEYKRWMDRGYPSFQAPTH